MPKPSDLPNWATDANYPAGSDPWSGTPTKVEPLSGEQAVGHIPKFKTPAEWQNWWQNLVYQWIAYLDASIFDGDVEIDGALTVDENLTVVGPTQMTDILDVTGNIHTDADIAAEGSITAGTGGFCHGDVEETISATSGNPAASGGTFGNGFFTSNASGGFYVNICKKVGDRLKSVSVMCGGDGSADALVTVYRIDSSGVAHSIGSTTITNPTTLAFTTINVTDTTLATGETFQVEYVINATGFVVGTISYIFDHPTP